MRGDGELKGDRIRIDIDRRRSMHLFANHTVRMESNHKAHTHTCKYLCVITYCCQTESKMNSKAIYLWSIKHKRPFDMCDICFQSHALAHERARLRLFRNEWEDDRERENEASERKTEITIIGRIWLCVVCQTACHALRFNQIAGTRSVIDNTKARNILSLWNNKLKHMIRRRQSQFGWIAVFSSKYFAHLSEAYPKFCYHFHRMMEIKW